MKFIEAINQLSDKSILDKLLKYYPDELKNIKGYWGALESIRTLTPKSSDFTILVEFVRGYLDEESYWSVSGINENEPNYLAIQYTPWEEWLDSELKYDKRLSLTTAVAHCLWEMTWSGFEQKVIQKRLKSLFEGIETK